MPGLWGMRRIIAEASERVIRSMYFVFTCNMLHIYTTRVY